MFLAVLPALGRVKIRMCFAIFYVLRFIYCMCLTRFISCFILTGRVWNNNILSKQTFKLGLSYPPLAQAGLDALESWNTNLPSDVLTPYFKNILPCFDGYLKSTAESGVEESRQETKTITMTTRTSSSRGRKIPLKLLKSSRETKDNTDAPLSKIRLQMLRLLGSLGGRVNMCLLGPDNAADPSRAVAWDTANHLSFAVPFQDMKPNIYLDPFLPRVVELATTSSDRQTKVAACELLHSLVLYMIGKGVTQPEGGVKSPMESLWKKIIPALLQLACDVEMVAKQLFRPLVSQLIHWFTSNRKYESPETIALLEALLDGVVHPTDTALRDFTAQCLREFLQWSIKQTSQKHLSKRPYNIKSLLKRLYSLALHPSSSKRLGAALAFNNIYTVFREESSLVDMFVLEILVMYLDSLAMAHSDDQAQGTLEQCKQVITHLERIIKVKASLLNKDDPNRRVPRGFESSSNGVTLSHVVPWLIKYCGKPQTECRHQSMRLVCQLAPLQPGVASAEFWMKETHKERPTYFIYRFEGGGGSRNGILSFPTLKDVGGPFSLKETLLWYDFLLASLDCYTWAFVEKLLSPKDVFDGSSPDAKYKSVLFSSLHHFLSDLAMFGVEAANDCFMRSARSSAEIFSPKEIDEYNRAKCTVIVRTMNFLTVLLNVNSNESIQFVPADFWSEHLFNTVLSCLLEPGAIGFNVGDVEVIENLPEQTIAVCSAFVRFLPKAPLSLFKDCLIRKLSLGSRSNLLEQLPIPLAGCGETQIDHLYLTHLINGYQQLHTADLLMEALQAQSSLSIEECGSRILHSVYESVRPLADQTNSSILLTPASQQLASKLLELALLLGLQAGTMEKCILDSSSAGNSDFGIAFYRAFQSVLNSYFIKIPSNLSSLVDRCETHPKLVCTILNAILDQVCREKILKNKYGSSTVSSILRSWKAINNVWTSSSSVDLKHSLLELLKKVLVLDSNFLSDSRSPSCDSVFTMYCSLLTDKSLALTLKSRGLELLPYFTRVPEKQLSTLKTCLDTLVADCFPLRSREFLVGSPKYNDYVAALDKLLAALVSSGSSLLLKLLTSIMCREEEHVYEDEIQSALTAFITRLHSSPSQAKQAIDTCFEVFTNERDHNNETRRAALMRMCVPLLCSSSKKAVIEFFTFHIKTIMCIVEAKSLKPSDPLFENQLLAKMCCFKLIEVLYTRLDKNELNSPQSLINKPYCNVVKSGKELTMAITKCAHSAKNEDMRGETVLLELRRQLHCYAYNALVALISCTQVEQKFYVGFLFTENTIKGQFLFDNLVDCNRKYEFETVLSAPIARKAQMMSIRTGARSRDLDEAGSPGYNTGRSIRYLSSQYLADSSLSEEVSQFDFSTPIQAFAATDVTDAAPSEAEYDVQDEEETYESIEDTVEMDELNQHECMGKMCALLKHLTKNIVTVDKEMPGWMKTMHSKFSSYDTHINVRLFLTKIIINEAKIFEPYANFWLTPLMELVLQMFQDEGPISRGINYYIVDVLVTMLFWSGSAIPEDTAGDRHLASRLVEAVMSRTHRENRSVLRNNLEIVKTMVEVWKNRIEVPTKVILEAFSSEDSTKKDNACGIQLLGVVLANGLSPFHSKSNIDEKSFYLKLVNNLSFKYKDVHAASAEVIGMMMKNLANDGKLTDSPLENMVSAKLQSFVTSTQQDTSKYIACVHKLQVNYPPIVDRFINRILFILPTVHGSFKTLCLEVVLSRVGHIPNLFQELKSKGLTEMLSYRDEGMQVALLRIIHGLLEKLSVNDLEYAMPAITAMSTNTSAACRELLYDILIWIYDNFRNDRTFCDEEGAEGILSTTKDHLLRGLMDENKELRLKMQNFWSDETRLPNTTLERLVDVLGAMYSPNTESQYLSYTTNLILHLTSVSPDFNRLMFEQPLSECKFEDYPIDYSWHQRNLSMTPLFAATQGSSLASGMSQSQGGSMEVGMVRTTQTRGFTPTQELGKSQAFDWMNPSSQGDSQSFRPSFAVGTTDTQSSLLFATKSRNTSRKYKPLTSDFGTKQLGSAQTSTQAETQESSEQKEILRLKRRFLKDDTSSRTFFAKREMMRKKIREQIKSRQQASRDSHVVMYRKYRAGDLPDIQIKHCELIAPLQAVAQCDSTIAKHLFTALFQAIFVEAQREGEDTVSDIQSALTNMATTSTQYFPPFVSSIQNICFNVSQLTIEPSSVSTSSLTSLQQPIGIMLLEKQLLKNIDNEPKKRKRARVENAPQSETTAAWLELAKLYRSIGEYDVLQGIFSDYIGTQDITKKALESEARGDYVQALKLYNQAIACEDWTNGEPQQEEEDLWHDARLECFNHLTQWDNLDNFSVINIDDNDPPDLDKVWSDTFYQEHYLPFIIRGKLKLCCQGGDSTDLLQFLNRALQVEERRAFLESRHSEDLALLHIVHGDYDRARYYVSNCLQGFLMDWSGLDAMMVGSRSSKLQSLQKMTEMQEFLEFIANEGNFQSTTPLKHLFDKWLSRFPDPKFHPMSVWDDVITNRCVFMDKIVDRFSAVSQWSDSMDSEEQTSGGGLRNVQNNIQRQKVLLQLKVTETAKEQANFSVAIKNLREAFTVINEGLKDDGLQLQWTHVYADVQHKKSHVLTAVESVETSLKTIGELEKFSDNQELTRNPTMALRHHILKGRTYDIMINAIDTEGDGVITSLDDHQRQRLMSLCVKSESDSSEQIVSQLMIHSFKSLQSAIKSAKTIEDREKNGDSSSSMVEAMMAMVKFCDSALRKREDDAENAPEIDVKLFPGIVVRYVLKAMTYCSEEARQRFPRLLQLVEIYPDTLEPFRNKASVVPCWVFIGWINQMVALMDKKEGLAVHGILNEIATTYPQALCFPFKISSEQFIFDNTKEGKANKDAVDRLRSLLENPLVDDFIFALEHLQNPEMAAKDWSDQMKSLLGEKQKSGVKTDVKENYLEMYKRLLDLKGQRGRGLTTSGHELGPYRRRFAQKFAKEFEKNFGKDGAKLQSMTVKKFDDVWKSLSTQLDNKKEKPPGNLKEYSAWLANFQSSNDTQKLEIPGQYTGRSKPLPEYHVKIAGFDERVLTMSSIRRPKRITIRGHDEKDHMFLVKGGEDLRLDQRIEQLFYMMNDILTADSACKQRNLRLRTYQVIPMTPRVGLIEWMLNTKPLKEVIYGAMTPTELQQNDKMSELQERWIRNYCSNPQQQANITLRYGALYSKASRTETETKFVKQQGLVPWNVLRRAFEQLSASPEAFLMLRTHFARTHACLCICQYLLGIGDRHLSNFMIDTVTGGMVGIDFGHAFGSATQFLPVPELMPFRLTRQIVNLLLPLKETGLLRSTMIHTLRALQENHELLLNTMDVFVKEPSLDWKEFAHKQARAQGMKEDDDKDIAWYPREKVNTARKKCLGANPAYITRDDIRLGHKTRKWIKEMENVCLGDKRVNIRAQQPEKGLSVETQIDCLIDQATDPNILGRTYCGWEPWM